MAAAPKRPAPESSMRGPRAVELLDEAVSLLRQAPLAAHAIYYLGALPFCFGLIYFWYDMSSSAQAEEHLAGEALALTGLYFWMKTCQAVFAQQLLAHLKGQADDPWPLRRWANTALLQIIFAGSFVIVYPVALAILLPLGWVAAFYHTISVVATGPESTVRSSFREAAGIARLWPRQNHLMLGILALASLVLFGNLAIFCFLIPQLLEMFFGFETVFVENGSAWNNSSFYLDVSVFCFLLLNPLSKAIHALRCFYGSARLNGVDLRAALRRQQLARAAQAPARARALAVALIIGLLAMGNPARAADAASARSIDVGSQLDPASATLDRSITKTLQQDAFAWRVPRPKAEEDAGETWLERSMKDLAEFLKKILKTPVEWMAKFLRWLYDRGGHDVPKPSSGWSLAGLANLPWRLILFCFLGLLAVLLALWLVRYLRQRGTIAPATSTLTAVRTVDLEAEDVRADDLPEDSWLALAQQMLEKGEPRLALRAFYLATLSVLAGQQLVRLGPAKSNRDYFSEATRRLRDDRTMLGYFRENIDLFEASWYGTHTVTGAIIDTMRSNQQQLRSHAAA